MMKLVFFCNFLVSFLLPKVRQEPIGIPEIIANCRSPLGMESRAIPDGDITASLVPFERDYITYGVQRARLHLEQPPYYGYRANLSESSIEANTSWIKINLSKETIITGISTQGFGDVTEKEWVTKYTLMYSIGNDFLEFRDTNGSLVKFTGNNDSNSVRHHDVPLPVITSEVMLSPKAWKNKIGLRMELYGCAPGYFFLARLILKDRTALYSLAFANKTSKDYRTWSADIIAEVTDYIRNVPGFLRAKLRRFRLGSVSDEPLESAEVEIHCIKEAAHFVASKFVLRSDSLFLPNINFSFPEKSGCLPSDIEIYIDGSNASAKKILTTSRPTLRAEITICNSIKKPMQSSWWERSIIIPGENHLPFQRIGNGAEHVLNPRIDRTDWYPVNLYVRFSAQLEGRLLQSYVLLKVSQPELVAKISGPMEVEKGIGEIPLNASESHDPDSFDERNLSFTWSCKRQKGEGLKKGTCQYGKAVSNGRILLVNVNKLASKHSYDFELEVSKGKRKKTATFVLTLHPSVNVTFSCRANCGKKVIQSKTMKIEPTCEGKLCNKIIDLKWSIHPLNSSNHSWKTGSPFVVKDLSIPRTSRNPYYKIKAVFKIQGKNDVFKEHYAEKVVFNSPPFIPEGSRGCVVTPNEGSAVQTKFTITCVGWRDEDEPLKYEFRYNTSEGLVINYPNARIGTNTLSTKLPVGIRADDFQLGVDVHIKDSLGDYTIQRVVVKVKNSFSKDIIKTLHQIANKENNSFTDFMQKREYSKACDEAISVLSFLDQKEGHHNVSKETARKTKEYIIDELGKIHIKDKELATKVSNVVAMATKDKDEISQESQEKALGLLENVTDFLAELAANKTEDPKTIKKLSSSILSGLGNILNMSAQDASVVWKQTAWYKIDEKKGKEIAQKSLKTIWKLRDCLVVNEGEDEPLVITSRYLSMVSYRLDNMNNETSIGDKETKFILPSYSGSLSELKVDTPEITSKIVLFKGNPYTWHKTAFKVASWVVDVVLQTEDRRNLNVSGLKNPVHLYIPQNSDNGSPADVAKNTVRYFVKPSYDINESKLIQYHKINVTREQDVVFVKLHPERYGLPLRVYVSYSDYPTARKHNYSTVIPCDIKEKKCQDPNVFSFNTSDTGGTGLHYIGIHFYLNVTNNLMFNGDEKMISMNGSIQERTRRSSGCEGGSRRKKRSCIGAKDPPLPPTPAPVVLRSKYNATTDLNYSLYVTVGNCFYWSEVKEQWTDEGCKVAPDLVSSSIHCLCNHLSAFGGDFFVEPNKIDFKMVFSKFGDPSKTKNYVVLSTVCSVLLVYIIGLVFTRRADRRDKQKAIPNVYLPDGEEKGEHLYSISIQTGMWVGSGTTANVGIIIYGEDCHSDQIILNDLSSKNKFFSRGSVNTFTMSLPRSLGPLYKIKVWHDNSGKSPGWFLREFIITELRSQEEWHFLANRWMAVEKGGGEVEIHLKSSNKEEVSKFKNLFYSRFSKRLADGHLWISVVARPPQSLFTRTQRLSCCMSVFFLAMITNAMFYRIGEDTKDTFQLGPLTMSWTQVKIGIQSALIVLPVNVFIVTVFQNVKAKTKRQENNNLEEENSSRRFPHFFLYIAWILCILAIVSSAFFTVLYSLSWGAKISNEWLTSILVSFLQDVIILQPIKVVLIASMLSIVIRKPDKHDPVHGLPRRKNPCEADCKVQPPEETVLKTSRTFWKKVQKMFRSVLEICLFLVFVLLLFIVCYGNRDISRFQLTKSLKDIFDKFDHRVNTSATFWNWTREMLVPGLFPSTRYNEKPVEFEEGFISSGYPFLVGMPRLRQIRVHTVPCQVDDYIVMKRCLPYYSSAKEDKAAYSLRGWTPIANVTEFEASFMLDDLCPKPWRYRSAESLETLSFNGFYASYGGGGYVADLGYNAESALGVIYDLETNGWIDERTFAVFIEFTVYEPSSTLFSAGKYLYERYPTGGTKTTGTIDTLMIYYPIDPSFRAFYLTCQLLLILLIFGLFVVEMAKLYFQGCRYFTHFWNLVDIVQISSAVAAMVSYFFKAKYTGDYVRRVRKNPFDTSSSDYIVQWNHLEIWLLSGVVFLATIKMLRLLKFSDHICHLTHTVKSAVRHLISYSLVFTATLIAYTQLGTLLFGSNVSSYSDMAQSLRMLLERLLGNNMYTNEMKAVNEVMGQLFTLAYSFSIGMILINMFLSILNSSYLEIRLMKQGRFPDAELAEFSLRYFMDKCQTFWHSTKRSLKSRKTKKVEKPRLKRIKAKYYSAPNEDAFEESDKFLCTKYDEVTSAESCTCLSAEEIQFEKATFEELDDIDFADEYSSLRDVRKTLFQIGTARFLTENRWSSGSLSDDDRADASSLISEWSYGKESCKMQSLFSLNRIESGSLEDDVDDFV